MQTMVNAEEDNLDGCLASPPCQLAFNKDNNLTDVYVKVDNQSSGSFTFTRIQNCQCRNFNKNIPKFSNHSRQLQLYIELNDRLCKWYLRGDSADDNEGRECTDKCKMLQGK
jgi:hypothetical protein